MTDSSTRPNSRTDRYLRVLADEYCRLVLRYFSRRSTEAATVSDLRRFVRQRTDADETQVEIRLHHVTLPKLDDAGLVEYDAETNTALYRGDETAEKWLREFDRGGLPA